MLEGLVAWVLNNYLGKYVQNLNTAQLSIALLSGQVELENLPLRKDALRHLGLPLQIKSGFIGKIKLQIPVRQIRSAPWVIQIEQLYLVATPLPVHEWDAPTEELSAQEIKLSALDNLEVKWRLENDNRDSSYYASSYSTWLSYGTGFITDIIENLQLKIRDVHFRYEDSITIPKRVVAFGLTMESLSAQSCDENWQPGFSYWSTTVASFKLLDMQKLAIYCTDLDYTEALANVDNAELAVNLQQVTSLHDNFILAPVSAEAHIKRNRSDQPLRSHDEPRIICDLQLQEVPLILVDWQYDQIVKCTKGLDDIATYRAYRKYRPSCTVKEDARAWWLYAISCLYPGGQPAICRPPPTWESCLKRAKENKQYVCIYTKILLTPAIALVPEEKKLKDDIEWARSYEDLKVLREISMTNVPSTTRLANPTNTAGRSTLVRWFPQWMGWYSATSDDNTDANQNDAIQLEGEILQALSDSFENNTVLKRDNVFGRFNFTLKSGKLSLCSRHEQTKESLPMMELQFKNVSLNIISKPRNSSYLIELSLGALYLCDKFTPNTLFPVLVGPPGEERTLRPSRQKITSPRTSIIKPDEIETLFYISFEKKPINKNADYRLCIKTKSLDVVYQPAAVKWLTEFLCMPHQRLITQSHIEAMKKRTKKEFIRNFEQMLDGKNITHKSWDLQFDITAPQIFFVEQFNDPTSSIAVIDFGRLYLKNNLDHVVLQNSAPSADTSIQDEDEEKFMTPCSTPPASEESDSEENTYSKDTLPLDKLDEKSFHKKLYDRYTVDLTDMQILIARVKDNWRYAHNKGTSPLHVLDRFNISLEIERRVVFTNDPQYPSLTLEANLPKLVVHINEYKISTARKLFQIIKATGVPSPFSMPETNMEMTLLNTNEDEISNSFEESMGLSRLLILQFTVNQLALEVQSRGRSVAELQVSGVRLAFTKHPSELNIALSVHSLLLVDALQTFGADFELLVASHKHVGMDSMSGSFRDSELTSPVSPGSPDCNIKRATATSPIALTRALTSLATSPPGLFPRNFSNLSLPFLDAEALISLNLVLVFGNEPSQEANIQFNNLDIIANQETIVELLGFVRRVFPDLNSQKQHNLIITPLKHCSSHSSDNSLSESTVHMGKTEITFDFHRLNLLLLRGVLVDGILQGKKICTATMSEAKIQATVAGKITVEGSLGGLHIVDLTPDGHLHQKILSVGHDPLLDSVHPLYLMSSSFNTKENEDKAFSFQVIRNLKSSSDNKDEAQVTVRMASLWYTHSPHFIKELQYWATEFKQYLANLAKSIKSAATDMALVLVHARAEALAQSIFMNSRLSASLYGSALSFSDVASPKRRRRSSSMEQSFSTYSSVPNTFPQTPYSPLDDDEIIIDLKLDISLDSPVLVLPRSSTSSQVFVAHLGKITVNNKEPSDISNGYELHRQRIEQYDIEVRDMNIFSLDTETRRVPGPLMSRAEVLYSCESLAKPILHDTIVQLKIARELTCKASGSQQNLFNLLMDDQKDNTEEKLNEDSINLQHFEITGVVTTALKLSLTRIQYEQLLDTIDWLTSIPEINDLHGVVKNPHTNLMDIREEDSTGVTTLNMDPHIRAKLFPGVNLSKYKSSPSNAMNAKVSIEVPVFTIELLGDSPTGEQGLVDLSFRDLIFIYDKGSLYETNIQVSLRSILMEDLLQPEGSKHRSMVVSSASEEIPIGTTCISNSCPNIYGYAHYESPIHGSLPDHLEINRIGGLERSNTTQTELFTKINGYPQTPPPSPTLRAIPLKNLVLISTLLIDPSAPNFKTFYNSVHKSMSIDFNCLDLVVNVESWVVVLDFFGISGPDDKESIKNTSKTKSNVADIKSTPDSNSETNLKIRSLNMVLVKPDRDVAKANISNIEIVIKKCKAVKEVLGKFGSMSLLDLTIHGQLYRERFITSGKQALNFNYVRYDSHEKRNFESQLTLQMSSVFYIHTKRFVAEIQAFFNHFTQIQAVMAGIHAATSGKKMQDEISRFSIILEAESPVILFPVSSTSSQLIIVDLGQLKVSNDFKYSGDPGTINFICNNETDSKCLLDVMELDLQNVNLQLGERESKDSHSSETSIPLEYYKMDRCIIRKIGEPFLTEKCQLKIQVERNLHSNLCHDVPNMNILGKLSTLDGTIDVSQYKLIRGFLSYNLGEDTEHILPSVQPSPVTAEPNIHELWTLMFIRLDLLNVSVQLCPSQKLPPLACINFIKSRLTVETFSNLSQDIDLISSEILLRDTRYINNETNFKPNIFSNILQSMQEIQDDVVQVEIHSRKRHDKYKFTILLNNIRLMAIFDWWELAWDFISQDFEEIPLTFSKTPAAVTKDDNEKTPFEIKVNITNSEIVVLENTSIKDTNAVIFKSTTVITYRSAMVEKPLSCNLNNCELFSCILGREEETALSIIDPVTVNLDINQDRVLDFHLQHFTVRLSYYDMQMFMRILASLPEQLFARKNQNNLPSEENRAIKKLTALGFDSKDCINALEICNSTIDDAALWLTQNAIPTYINENHNDSITNIQAIEVKGDNIFVCIIDDCGDADVPLLEVTFSKIFLKQGIQGTVNNREAPTNGAVECVLSVDYYNRILSGWEPVVEPWKCFLRWDHTLSENILKNRLEITLSSKDVLNINITSTLIDLYRQVKDSWLQDLYNNKSKSDDVTNYRQRSPFIPYILKNDTGSPLYFSTLITKMDKTYQELRNDVENWRLVNPGENATFSYKSRDKVRHSDSHKMRLHHLGVQIEGFQHIHPVTVDKVGIYFRHAEATLHNRDQKEVPRARIVFEVEPDGSARKLITVRSALQLINNLPENVKVKLESQLPHEAATLWVPSKTYNVQRGDTLCIPLVHVHSIINVRPIDSKHKYIFCTPSITWNQVTSLGDVQYDVKTCHSHRGKVYKFCAQVKRENYPQDKSFAYSGNNSLLEYPGHTITLLPTVLIVNLLPTDFKIIIADEIISVEAGEESALTFVNLETPIGIEILLENFSKNNKLLVPTGTTNFTSSIHMKDDNGRKLVLTATISQHNNSKLKIVFAAPFWIVNKTGIPIVFKQAGTNTESAGQYEEHELARMMTPLLFSFADHEASPTVVARVGTHVIPAGVPQWCQQFDLQRGIQVRKLQVSMKDERPEVVFVVGIEVRQGRGRYRNTSIITISPRYQLHNKSSYKLLFAQQCFSGDIKDPLSKVQYLKAMRDSYMAFHWPRLDQEQLLCVLIQDIPDCCWSGGLRIDENYSMHVNIRDSNGRMYFLRLEVVLQGATFFVIFTDADTMPPPIRIDNFSLVSIKFAQTSHKDSVRSVARAHSSVPYAWDQPTKKKLLTIVAPGDVSHNYDITKIGDAKELIYQNYIYIAFTGTFKKGRGVVDPTDVETQELVLDFIDNFIILSRKEEGRRSQLWRLTDTGQLHHEGSSPPLPPNQVNTDKVLVLDIEGLAPQPSSYTRLVLRRPDPRRKSTQTWRFTNEGRLCCIHHNMYVQAQDGFFGLREGSAVVLGMPQPVSSHFTDMNIPMEQAVSYQYLRPGSGFLSVKISTDGPTRVLSVYDKIQNQGENSYTALDEHNWSSISKNQRTIVNDYSNEEKMKEFQITLTLSSLGISVISSNPPQELVYAYFKSIISELVITSKVMRLCVSVGDIQINNQLLEAPIPALLYVSANGRNDLKSKLPALEVHIELMQPILNENAIIFNSFIVHLKKITVHLEELFILKMLEFVSYNSKDEELCKGDENDYEMQRLLTEVSASHSIRYYFGIIRIAPDQVKLSMKTAGKLPPSLQEIKKKLGIPFIKFEDARVDLEPYVREHPFETLQFLTNSIMKHFKDELLWQAAIILVSVDFLGNPLGFVNDVSEGVSGLIKEGNVGVLVKNVMHGISNSAAKVTESLSDGLGKVTMDDEHEEMRQRIMQVESGSSKDHLVAGIKGFGFGLLGGATGIFKQVYEGVANEGIPGAFSGFGKGLVGAVTKPVVGALDLASETARAVRDSSRSSSKISPERTRLPRVCIGAGSLLPRFSKLQSLGQQYLYVINNRHYNEQLVAHEYLKSGSKDLSVIISNLKVRIVTTSPLTTALEIKLSELEKCKILQEPENAEIRNYVELTVHVTESSSTLAYKDPVKKPKILCESLELAKLVTRQINYAKRLYDERKQTLSLDNVS